MGLANKKGTTPNLGEGTDHGKNQYLGIHARNLRKCNLENFKLRL